MGAPHGLDAWLVRLASRRGWHTLNAGEEDLFHYASTLRLVEFQYGDNEFGDSVIFVRAPGLPHNDPHARLELDPPMPWLSASESFRGIARPGMLMWLQSRPDRPVMIGECNVRGGECKDCPLFEDDELIVAYQRVWIGAE